MIKAVNIKKEVWPYLPYTGILPLIAMYLIFRGGFWLVTLLHILIISFGYIAAYIDFRQKKIPNTLILVMLCTWGFIFTLLFFMMPDFTIDLLFDSMFGFVVGGGMFLIVYVVSKKGLGGGDVKFMAATGLYMGVFGIIPVILYGTILAALTALALMLFRRIGRKDTIPLAPFLYIGILLSIFFA